MSRSEYSWKAGLGVGFYMLLTLAFPFITMAIISATNARSVSGAAGAVAVLVGAYLKPLIYIAAVGYLAGPSWRRMRALGLSPVLAMAIPVLMLGDLGFGIAFNAFWGVGFSFGVLAVLFPFTLAAALFLIVLLCVLPDETPVLAAPSRLQTAWTVSIYVLEALAAWKVLLFASPMLLGPASLPLFRTVITIQQLVNSVFLPPIALVVLATTSLLLVLNARQEDDAGPAVPLPPAPGRRGFGRR